MNLKRRINMGNLIKEWIENPDRHNKKEGNIFLENRILYSYGKHFPLAVRVKENILVNGDRYSVTTSSHQNSVNGAGGDKCIVIPFSAARSAGINLYDHYLYSGVNNQEFEKHFKVIDVRSAKWTDKQRKDPKTGELITYQEHLLGASLFRWLPYVAIENTSSPSPKWNYDGEWKYYLSGIDSTGKGRGNYFLTELVKEASTVTEALEQLKPESVKIAESKGVEVSRQGEFFVLYTNEIKPKDVKTTKPYKLVDRSRPGILTPSSHIATEGYEVNGVEFVRGTIRHRDHTMLKLGKEFWLVARNIQKASFSAGGGVD
jgi:hypothetical protein